jgi:hypothetical protein
MWCFILNRGGDENMVECQKCGTYCGTSAWPSAVCWWRRWEKISIFMLGLFVGGIIGIIIEGVTTGMLFP